VTGGERIGTVGSYVQPTIFADVPRSSQLFKEEVFGPVGAFLKFETLSEAVEIANDCDYALAAGIWCNDVSASLAIAKELEAGTVWVNGMMTTWGYNTPFGGGKLTGGGRTNGREGLLQYLHPRSINIKTNPLAGLKIAKL